MATNLAEIATPGFLSSIRSHSNLPPNSWYFIVAVTLSILNRPDEIPKVFRDALENGAGPGPSTAPDHAEQLQIARKMREALVKAIPIGGVPKTINSLLSLKTATPRSLLDEPQGFSPTSRRVEIYDVPTSEIMQRGEEFFDKLYGKVASRVNKTMDQSGTEDLGLAARLVYSYIMSNTSVLSAAESSYVLLAGLIPQDVNPQLKGHLQGAVNNGATVLEAKAVRDVVIRICEAAGMKTIGESVVGGWGWRGEIANL